MTKFGLPRNPKSCPGGMTTWSWFPLLREALWPRWKNVPTAQGQGDSPAAKPRPWLPPTVRVLDEPALIGLAVVHDRRDDQRVVVPGRNDAAARTFSQCGCDVPRARRGKG